MSFRVSDTGNRQAVQESFLKNRAKMQELHIQGASGKKLNTPQDDPVGNSTLMRLRTDSADTSQYVRNIVLGKAMLNFTDSSLEDLTEVLSRAKELAVQQASGATQTQETRMSVAQEVDQLYIQALNIANRRLGDRFVFAGFKTHEMPFGADGTYRGDSGLVKVEVEKGTFLDLNVPGDEIFLKKSDDRVLGQSSPEKPWVDLVQKQDWELPEEERKPASIDGNQTATGEVDAPGANVFRELKALKVGLVTGDIPLVQSTLDGFDELINQVINVRARIGSRVQSLENSEGNLSNHKLHNEAVKSQIEDADMAEVAADMAKTETALRAGLEMGSRLVKQTLMDFLR